MANTTGKKNCRTTKLNEILELENGNHILLTNMINGQSLDIGINDLIQFKTLSQNISYG